MRWILKLATTLALVCLSCLVAVDLTAQTSLVNTEIAFVSNRDGNAEIYVMSADGMNLVNLTNHPATDGCPDWSPNGTKIAFHSDRDGDNEIYVMNADGTGLTQLTNNSGYDVCPSWSPDGTKIVFQSAPNVSTQTDIWVMNASDGSGLTELSNNLGGDAPDWSPDGTKIVFASIRSGNNDIWVMNADGTNPVNLTNTGSLGDGEPKWSPDSTKIVFRSAPPGGNYDIYVMDANGANVAQLTTDGALSQSPLRDDLSPSWSPDSAKIVFSSYRPSDGNYEIYVMDANGTNPVRLTNNPAVDQQPSWSPFFLPTIDLVTNQTTYRVGDRMVVTQRVTNPGTTAYQALSVVYLELPNQTLYSGLIVTRVLNLTPGFDKTETVVDKTIPSAPVGTYKWHGVLLEEKKCSRLMRFYLP